MCPSLARLFTTVLPLVALVAIGCGGRGDVTGKVSYQGKPLVFGTVQLEASDKILRQSNIGEDGSYSIRSVPVGEIKVAVNSPNPNGGDRQPLIREGQEPPPPREQIKGWFAIPAEYQNLSKPQLTYAVKNGQNTIDIEMK